MERVTISWPDERPNPPVAPAFSRPAQPERGRPARSPVPARPAWKPVMGKIVRFVFTPEDTTAAWGREKRVHPERIASARLESFKALFWIAVSVTLSLAVAAL